LDIKKCYDSIST
jgi:telomerase reverse transcriptase